MLAVTTDWASSERSKEGATMGTSARSCPVFNNTDESNTNTEDDDKRDCVKIIIFILLKLLQKIFVGTDFSENVPGH